jgi:hypothetical protein
MTIQKIKTAISLLITPENADLVREILAKFKNPYLQVEGEFSGALAVLAIVQDGFTDDTPGNENIYFALESVRRELYRAREILEKM